VRLAIGCRTWKAHQTVATESILLGLLGGAPEFCSPFGSNRTHSFSAG